LPQKSNAMFKKDNIKRYYGGGLVGKRYYKKSNPFKSRSRDYRKLQKSGFSVGDCVRFKTSDTHYTVVWIQRDRFNTNVSIKHNGTGMVYGVADVNKLVLC